MPVIVGVALGGAIGASARYVVDRFVEQRTESVFPWSIFAVNVSGCLLIGLITATLTDREHVPAWVRVGLVVGVIGGYTTFSTFAQESLDLTEARQIGAMLAYTVGSVAFGMTAVFLGVRLGRLL